MGLGYASTDDSARLNPNCRAQDVSKESPMPPKGMSAA